MRLPGVNPDPKATGALVRNSHHIGSIQTIVIRWAQTLPLMCVHAEQSDSHQ